MGFPARDRVDAVVSPLEEHIVGGVIVVFFGIVARRIDKRISARLQSIDKLEVSVAALTAEFKVMKEYWIRTSERRDKLIEIAERWKNYALRVHSGGDLHAKEAEPIEPIDLIDERPSA